MHTKIKHAVSSVATAAILCYAGISYSSTPDFMSFESNGLHMIKSTGVIPRDCLSYTTTDRIVSENNIETLHAFAKLFLENVQDLDPDFSKTVDENFWDLI